MPGTRGSDYTDRLQRKSTARWKQVVDVQAPYRWNLRRQQLGRTLDVGCGIGRNLAHLDAGSVGVDHNETSVKVARAAGLEALTVEEWLATAAAYDAGFDAILVAHVIEHVPSDAAVDLLRGYLPALRPGGKVFLICPQERGYASDTTHVQWTTGADLEALATSCGLVAEPWRSFPLPRALGRAFVYNEFTLMAHHPGPGAGS